jgi:photosynthetic reaction center cytochrome c subunit
MRMQKLFLNVAASLPFVALVILAQAPTGAAQGPAGGAQAPAGAPQAPAGPDAAATNLVNTVCASCHALDRVRNKVADLDAWTATVTRMVKEKGAELTDQQVPVVVEFLNRAAATLTVAPPAGGRGAAPGGARGAAPGGARGGTGGRGAVAPFSAGGAAVVSASNLKVLTAQNVEFTMQNITFALNLRCIDCHDVTNLSLDTKPLKLKARSMLEMVRDLNTKLGNGDGKTHVTCWTCHRASTTPQLAKPAAK